MGERWPTVERGIVGDGGEERGQPWLRMFLSYRREDAAGHAGRLYDDLTQRFGAERVFMDVDAIAPGAAFAQVIESAVSSCDVLLAVIGTRWLTATDREGRSRLSDPQDWVRLEITAALDRDIPVIPLLVQGASMPDAEALPPLLAPLAGREALELSDVRSTRPFREPSRLLSVDPVLRGSQRPQGSMDVVSTPASLPRPDQTPTDLAGKPACSRSRYVPRRCTATFTT